MIQVSAARSYLNGSSQFNNILKIITVNRSLRGTQRGVHTSLRVEDPFLSFLSDTTPLARAGSYHCTAFIDVVQFRGGFLCEGCNLFGW